MEDLTFEKWKYVNYLIELLYSFYLFINVIKSIDNELII